MMSSTPFSGSIQVDVPKPPHDLIKQDGLKQQTIRILSLIFGVMSFIKIARNRSLVVGLPLITLTISLSSVGVYYPDFVLNKITSLLFSRIQHN